MTRMIVMNLPRIGMIVMDSVSDPYHFDSDPDPGIRIRDDGSGSNQVLNTYFLIMDLPIGW